MVVGVMTHFFQVVVFAGNPKALLCVSNPPGVRLPVPQEYVLEGIHARIGEHEGRIVLQNHGSRGNNLVFFFFKKA